MIFIQYTAFENVVCWKAAILSSTQKRVNIEGGALTAGQNKGIPVGHLPLRGHLQAEFQSTDGVWEGDTNQGGLMTGVRNPSVTLNFPKSWFPHVSLSKALKPEQRGQQFADNILKCTYFNQHFYILIKISPAFVRVWFAISQHWFR